MSLKANLQTYEYSRYGYHRNKIWIEEEIRINYVRAYYVNSEDKFVWRWKPVKQIVPGRWVNRKDYSNPLLITRDQNYEYKWWYDRNVKTLQEIRENDNFDRDAYDEGLKIRTRAKRNLLPTYYDDPRIFPPGRNWKRTHKIKKQWMKNEHR